MGSFAVGLFLALIWFARPHLAHAKTIEETCAENFVDMSVYRTCVARLTTQQSRELKQSACSASVCFYRLSCSQADYPTCTGSGFSATYRPAPSDEYGTNIFVIDPNGKTSKFGQVGSQSIEYVSGPLEKATLRKTATDLILEVPK